QLAQYYLWMDVPEPKEGRLNAGQRATYSMWLFLLIFEALTGFALYGMAKFQWVGWVLQGMGYVRMLHFLGAWLFIITTLAHVYLGLYHGLGLLRGIITGYEEPRKA
ncbi:MAG: cytochrome b/b6 domain-containing protein, partial [Bacillota bacterium]|nr:cytochrome b/b6 domain-containing protein [Bacillota bacterium]